MSLNEGKDGDLVFVFHAIDINQDVMSPAVCSSTSFPVLVEKAREVIADHQSTLVAIGIKLENERRRVQD